MAKHKLNDNERVSTVSTKRLKELLGKAGKYPDGNGLYLQVAAPGQGSWVSRLGEKWKSLGPADEITADAARAVHEARKAQHKARSEANSTAFATGLVTGSDPATAEVKEEAPAIIIRRKPFADVVEEFLSKSPAMLKLPAKSTEPRKYRHLKTGKLGKLWTDEMTSDAVATELLARWGHALASAEKYRMRIKLVCDYARAKGYRAENAVNPANDEDLKNLVSKPPKSKPHPSLPVADCPAFFSKLSADTSPEARSLGFAILTAARTGEARDIDWSEIEGNVWHIPASRMKEGESNGDHFVPLSPAALALLGKSVKAGRIFGSLPHDALDNKLKEHFDLGVATVHGFRASFNGWAVKAKYPESLWGRALHHVVGNKTGKSYNREPLIEERHPMMDAWSRYLIGE